MISQSPRLSSLLNRARLWAAHALAVETAAREDAQKMKRRAAAAIIFVTVFLAALGVRVLHWQDLRVEMEKGDGLVTALGRPYRQEAKRMSEQGHILFPSEPVRDGDARSIIHPPGYSILILAICGASDDTTALVWFQIICDALSAAILFSMAAELFPLALAAVAGLLAAVSPHLAYYSLWLTPESLAAAMVLIAVYLIVRAQKRPRFVTVISAGAFIGLSCWLRANGLLLAPFLAVVILVVFDKDRRLRMAGAFTAAALLVIAPITVRNAVVYRHFIPLSLGAGITFVEGIGDYDKEGRFGFPSTDKEAVVKDAEWHGKPEYGKNLWTPDGVEHDRYRFSRGIEVVRSNPGWFIGVLLDRAAGMLRYNDSFGHGRDWHIGAVSTIAAEPPFNHSTNLRDEDEPVWSNEPAEMIAGGELVSRRAETYLNDKGQLVLLADERAGYSDQFASAVIPLNEGTDYILRIPVTLEQGKMAVKVTSPDRSITLNAALLEKEEEAKIETQGEAEVIEMAFASGEMPEARLVISNNGSQPSRPSLILGSLALFEAGPTPSLWTRAPRFVARSLQKNIFKTSEMLAAIAAGLMMLILARRSRQIAVLLAVPLYYLSVQSWFHTEYRYILAIHLFLFILVAVTIYCLALATRSLLRAAWRSVRPRRA